MKAKNGLYHLVASAISDFKRNKVRTLLTSLGIMIGVLSVVMLIALGLGLKNYIQQQFEDLGTNIIMIFPGSGMSQQGGLGALTGMVGGVAFDERDVSSLSRISELDYVIPIFFKGVTVEAGGKEEYGYIFGASEDIFRSMNFEMEEGEVFDKADVSRKAKIGVLGSDLAKDLFGKPSDAVGRTVRFLNQRFKVIGVAKKKGDNEMDSSVVMPYKTTYGSINPDKVFQFIYLGVDDKDLVAEVKVKVEETMLKRYKEDDFSVTEQTEILTMINTIFGVINGVLIAIGSISLLVGGIGIMNIMYATVTERTREVGIRRAVGATQKDILLQFLSESVLLSIFGGLAGLLLATIIVILVHPLFPLSINALAVIITLMISSFIGIFFGVFPARRAAKLPPIEAIRYE
jgi:putative ABC transport system permease protein